MKPEMNDMDWADWVQGYMQSTEEGRREYDKLISAMLVVDMTDETFEYVYLDEKTKIVQYTIYNISEAKRNIVHWHGQRNIMMTRLDFTSDIIDATANRRGVDHHYAMSRGLQINDPLIACVYWGVQTPVTTIIIDGWHRLYRRYQDGLDHAIVANVIDSEAVELITIYRVAISLNGMKVVTQ